jgi:outer membrane murein-binding lipoprotein Lpp
MSAIRAQLSWMARGRQQTVATLDAISSDLRELQAKVAAIELQLGELVRDHHGARERQLDQFDRLREAVAGATDDLAARIAALDARLGSAG